MLNAVVEQTLRTKKEVLDELVEAKKQIKKLEKSPKLSHFIKFWLLVFNGKQDPDPKRDLFHNYRYWLRGFRLVPIIFNHFSW